MSLLASYNHKLSKTEIYDTTINSFFGSLSSVLKMLIVTIIINILFIQTLPAQCPTVTSIGSDKIPAQICSPVSADLEFSIGFLSSTPVSSTVEAFYFWNDGSPATIVNLTPGLSTYNVIQNHAFPDGEDVCEYVVEMLIRINGTFCTSTRQVQRVTSWQPDNLAGGEVELQSPQGSNIYEVCEGDDVSVIFEDITQFNCNVNQDPDPNLPDTPNEQYRWQQIVYNTAGAGAKIPTTSVNGVPITDLNGNDVIFEYEDPRGVKFLPSPVEAGDTDRRNTLEITAPGGFGPNFPVVGDEIEITIKYWNFCNPYDSDISDGNEFNPVNGDLINGDNPPVISTAIIRIVDAPDPPVGIDRVICQGDGVGGLDFEITGTTGSTAVNWYDNDPNAGGVLITADNSNGGNSSTFPASDLSSFDANTPGIYSVWATYQFGGGLSCLSDAVETTITVRDELNPPGPINGSNQVCNNTTNVAFSVPSPAGTTLFGGPVEYEWEVQGGSGVTLSSTTAQNITVDFNIGGSFTSVTRRFRVRRIYSSMPTCPSTRSTLTVTIYGETLGGTTEPNNTICEGDNTGPITLTGHRGNILNWERSENNGAFISIANGGNATFSEVLATAGTYEYRAVIKNGACTTERSSTTLVTVNPIPTKPVISEVGDGLDICENGDQVLLESSNVDGNADEYAWFKDPDTSTPIQQTASNQLMLSSVSESGTYYVQVIGIDPTYCESALSDPIDVTINPLPSATLTGGGSVCNGSPGPPSVITMTGIGPFNVTYERDGTPITANNVNSPYTIPGSSLVADGTQDVYDLTSVTDLGTTVNCTSTAPSPNVNGSTTIEEVATPAPIIQNINISPDECANGPGTATPTIELDLFPNAIQNYDITYEVRNSVPALIFSGLLNKSSDAAGVITFGPSDLSHLNLGDNPDTYEINVISIINTANSCSAFTPPFALNFTINPRPSGPTNPVNAITCSSSMIINPISVDDPGDGLTVKWFTSFTDQSNNTPVTEGVASGNNGEVYTPASSATATFFAAIENDDTGCLSNNAVAVNHTEDVAPSAANADTDGALNNETCNTFYTLSANTPASGTGQWIIADAIYTENFNDPLDDGVGAEGPGNIITSPSSGKWSVDVSGSTGLTASTDYFKVDGQRFVGRDVNGTVEWRTSVIDISSSANVNVSVDISKNGSLEGTDLINVYYSLNGGANVLLNDGAQSGNFADVTASATGLSGSTLEIIIEVQNNADSEEIYFDNVSVIPSGATSAIISDVFDPNATVSNLQLGPNDFTWSISSDLGVCPDEVSTVTIIRNSLPVVNDPNPELCELQPRGSGVSNADLTSYEDLISDVTTGNRNVLWYTDPGLSSNPADITNHQVTNGSILYFTVENTITGCINNGEVTFTVITLPEIVDQDQSNNPLETVFCEESVGSADKDDIDLTLLNNDVSNGVTSNRTIEWFSDPGVPVSYRSDLTGNEISIPNDVDDVADGTIFYSIVQNTLTGCEDIAQTTITVNSRPIANPIRIGASNSTASPVIVCKSDDLLYFRIDAALNSNSTYNWNVPTGPGELEVEAGGTSTDHFIFLKAPNEIASPGLTISVFETSPDGCEGELNTIDVIVVEAPLAPEIEGDQQVCTNQSNVSYKIKSPTAGSVYTWNIGALGSIVAGQGTEEIFVNVGTVSDNITVTETSSTGCTSSPSAGYFVNVNPRPNITSPNTAIICSGTSVDSEIIFTSDIPGTDYSWQVQSKSVFVGGTVVTNSGTGNIDEVLTNSSNTFGTVVYEVTPISPASCGGPVQTITISVEPTPTATITTTTPTICTDENVDINISTLTSPTDPADLSFNYTVTSTDIANTGGTAFSGGTGQTYPLNLNGTLTNTNPLGNDIIVTYTVTPLLAGCPSGSNFTLDIIVKPEPIGNDLTVAGECSNVGFNINPDNISNGLGGTSTYTWVRKTLPVGLSEITSGSGSSTISETLQNLTGTTLNAEYVVTPTSSVGCVGDQYTITVPINSEPVGVDDTKVAQCSNVTFNFDPQADIANGVSSTFTWTAIYNGMTGGAGAGSGVISEALVNRSGAQIDAIYTVTATSDPEGCVATTTFDIIVPIDTEPVGANDTKMAQCSNDAFSFDPQAEITNGVNSTFTWTANYNGLTGGAGTGSGVINEALVNTSGTQLNAVYTITATSDPEGCVASTTFDITVPIDSEPVGADDIKMAQCSSVAFSFNPQTDIINGVNSTFSWTANYNGMTGGTGAGNGVINETLINTSGAQLNAVYTITATSNPQGCVAGTTFNITVPVDSEPVGADLTVSAQCSNSSFNINPDNISNGLGASSTYTWVRKNLPAGLTEVTSGSGNGAISEILQNLTGTTLIAEYVVTPTSAAGCSGKPYTVRVPIISEPVGTDATKMAQCSNVAFSFNPQTDITNGVNSTFTWTANYNGMTGGAGTGSGVINETLVNTSGAQLNAVYTITATSDPEGCIASTTFDITVPIDSEPVGADDTKLAQCSNVSFSFDPQADITNGVNSTFTWTANYNGMTGGTGTGNGVISETLENTSGAQLNAVYTITATSNPQGCVAGTSFNITVPVDSEPVGADLTVAAQCSDVGFNIDPDNITNGLGALSTFTWVRNPMPTGLTEIASGSGISTISETLQNLTGNTLIAVYVVTPISSEGCQGDPYTINVPIDSEPAGSDLTVSAECSDVSFNINPDNINNGLGGTSSYSWVRNTLPAGLTEITSGSGNNTISETLKNLTGNTLNAEYVVTPISNEGCEGDPYTITVPIGSEPVGFDDTPPVQCSGATLSYNIQTRNINTQNGLLSQFTYVVSSDNPAVPAAPDRTTPSIDPITDGYINNTGSDVTITYTITPISLVNGCTGSPFEVDFVFNSAPQGFDDAFTECSDVALNYDLQTININDPSSGNAIPSDFTYTVSSSSGSVPPASGRTVKSDLPITDTYTNTTGSPVTITYNVTPISKGSNCKGDPFTVTFTIDSEPFGTEVTNDVCGGGSINFDLQGQISSGLPSKFYYNVTSSSPGDIAPEPNRLKSNASTSGISTNYTNTSGAPVLITYEVFPIANDGTNCEGDPFLVRFNIIPGPEGADDTDSYCSGEQINYDIQNDNVAVKGNNIPGRYTYVVSSSNESVIPTPVSLNRTAASDLPITDTFINNSVVDVTVTYTITPISDVGGCKGTPFDVEFVVAPVPKGGDDLNNIFCSKDVILYDIQIDNIDMFNGLSSEFIYSVNSSDPANVPADMDRNTYGTSPINTSYVNKTSSPVFITYTVTPRETTTKCVGESFDIRFQVNPEPVVNPNLETTVCSRETMDVILATNGSSVNAASYSIINVVLPTDPNFTANPSNAIFPRNNVSSNYIRLDKYENNSTNELIVQYEVVPISADFCEGDLEVIEVTIQPEPKLSPSLSPAPLCSGLPAMITLIEDPSSVAAAEFNINGISIANGLTPAAGNANLGDGQPANAIFNDTFINTTNSQLRVTYTIAPVTAAGCEGPDQSVIFLIDPSPELASLNDIVCSDAATGLVLGTTSFSSPAVNYQIVNIQPDAGLVPGIGNATDGITTSDVSYLSNDVFSNPTNGVLTVEYDIVPISGPGCRGPQKTIVITVEPQIVANDPPDFTICSGDIASIALSSPTVPSSGNITFDISANGSSGLVNGFTFFAQNLGNGTSVDDVIINNSDDPQTVTYQITPRAFGADNGSSCSASSSTEVVITILPEPKVEASENMVTICEGENLSIDLTSPTNLNVGNIEFELLSDPVATGGVTGFSAAGTIFNPGDQLTDVLNNPTTSNQTVTYEFTPRSTGTTAGTCVGEPITIVVTVTPRPTVTPSVLDVRICSGELINVSLPTDVANSIAAWTVSNNSNVIGQFDGLGGSLFQSLINTSSVPQVLTYSVQPFLLLDNACTGPVETITVTIDPIPNVILPANQFTLCSGEDLLLTLDGDSPNTTFEVTATSSNPDLTGYSDFTGTNGDLLNQTINNTGITSGTILYTITPIFNQPAPGTGSCSGVTEVVIVTVSPPVSGEIATESEIVCTGNTKSIQFDMGGAPPFTLTLDNGEGTTPFQLENLANRYVILLEATTTYRLLEVEDFNGCKIAGSPLDEVTIEFREAVADFTINGSKSPAPVTLDFNSGTATVDIKINSYNPQNIYEFTIGEDVVPVTGPSFSYTFNQPSEPGGLGYFVELRVEAPETTNPCNDIESFFIEVLPAEPTVVGVASITAGCTPLVVDFSSFLPDLSLSKNVQVSTLTWDFDDGQAPVVDPNPRKTFTEPGVYQVRVTGNNGFPGLENEDSDIIEITVYATPVAVFESNQEVVFIPDDPFRPINRSVGADEYLWDWGDGSPIESSRSPQHFYEMPGDYKVMLEALTENNCSDTTSMIITVEEGGFVKLPNAFTPNPNGPSSGMGGNTGGAGAQLNDIFLPVFIGVEDFRMMIFDRWGNLIFESRDKNIGWDGYNSSGKILPAGAYVYKVEMSFANGQRTTRVGDVTLIR